MPGFVAIGVLFFAAIAGLFCALVAYWISKFAQIKTKTTRAFVAVGIGSIAGFGLIWDFERFQTYEISDEEAERVLGPLIANGGAIKHRYAFTEGLSFGDYYLVEIPNQDFSSFIAERPHNTNPKDAILQTTFVLIDEPPEWLRDFECDAGVAYTPDFTGIEQEIDEFDLIYCAQTTELLVAKLRV